MNCALAVLSNLTAFEQSRGVILLGLSPLVPEVQFMGGAPPSIILRANWSSVSLQSVTFVTYF